jgi:hypothetical protein
MVIKKMIRYLIAYLQAVFYVDGNIKNFIRHNRRVWGDSTIHGGESGEVLFEFNPGHSSIIAFSYLANVLYRKFNATIVAYSLNYTSHQPLIMRKLRRIFGPLIPLVGKQIFSSFGVKSFMLVDPTMPQRDKAARLFEKVYPSLQTKRDIEDLVVDGVWIGDLIYDTYLRRFSMPTIDLMDEQFIDLFRESLGIFVFWQEYFETHDVKAINVTHCVYNNAIPLRIAVRKRIPVYQSNATHVYRMSESNLFAYGEYKYFPETFRQLPVQERVAGMQEARKRIELRFTGRVGVDMRYSTKSAYGEKRDQPVLRKSNKLKVLIAAHCFFDSPHSYGNNLFPDFYEWFDFLGRISNETDYDWYVKTHPDFLPGNAEIIQQFLKRYPRFTLIDAGTSHHQLIEEGISCALTTYGTIGFEYAALGALVVNASICNPHVAYNFNLHPKSIKEYEDILRSLGSQSLKINKDEVYEYYFMKFIYGSEGWLFEDYREMLDQLGGYDQQFLPQVYSYFLRSLTESRHRHILSALGRFVDSGEFCMGREHIGNDLSGANSNLLLHLPTS